MLLLTLCSLFFLCWVDKSAIQKDKKKDKNAATAEDTSDKSAKKDKKEKRKREASEGEAGGADKSAEDTNKGKKQKPVPQAHQQWNKNVAGMFKLCNRIIDVHMYVNVHPSSSIMLVLPTSNPALLYYVLGKTVQLYVFHIPHDINKRQLHKIITNELKIVKIDVDVITTFKVSRH